MSSEFSSGLLNAPDRLKATEPETFDGEKIPVVKTNDLDNMSDMTNPQVSNREIVEQKYKEENQRDSKGLSENDGENENEPNEDKKEENLKTIMIGSRKAATKLAKAEGSDYDTDSEDDWEAVEGEEGLFYKHHIMSPALKYQEKG